MTKRKKVILCIIDSLHREVLEECFRDGLVPAWEFIKDHGTYYPECISSFPTMTPTAVSSITTGQWADAHGIPGFAWYNHRENRFVNYGANMASAIKLGLNQSMQDLFLDLNRYHLSPTVKTIFENLAEHGVTSGSINSFVHRGPLSHPVRWPWLMRLLTQFARNKKASVSGPKLLVAGKVCRPEFIARVPFPFKSTAPWRRYGINDTVSGMAAEAVARSGLPDFTVIYFPGTDHEAHDHGPLKTHQSLVGVDRWLQRLLDTFGSWEAAMEQAVFILTGDHSQSDISREEEHIIYLDRLLSGFRRLPLHRPKVQRAEIAISPNERMAYIDILQDNEQLRDRVIQVLSHDPRVDLVMWKEGQNYLAVKGGSQKKFCFRPGGNLVDDYGRRWEWEGCPEVIDARVEGDQIIYGDYPDALARMSSALDTAPAGLRVALSAVPLYEFHGECAPIHPGGGSHGSLHRIDSLIPLTVGGTDQQLENPRIIDLYQFVLREFGIENS
ncbi:MAG: alkaline phosphatase family protein [Bacillota bacterium]